MIALLLIASAAGAGVGVHPINPSSWVVANDYPPGAMMRSREGTAAFRLEIGIDGKPTECGILSSSGSQELDIATCDTLIARARFTPAVGPDGYPAIGHYSSSIHWMLPNEELPWTNVTAVTHIDLDSQGHVSGCRDGEAEPGPEMGCSFYGQPGILGRIVATPLAGLRSVEIRHQRIVSDSPGAGNTAPEALPPAAAGRWILTVNPAGRVAKCHEDDINLRSRAIPTVCDPGKMASMHFPKSQPGGASRTISLIIEIVTQPR